ncbi:hypothetical protein SUDANB180_04516 [Streptomyces sp. enrichment culture]
MGGPCRGRPGPCGPRGGSRPHTGSASARARAPGPEGRPWPRSRPGAGPVGRLLPAPFRLRGVASRPTAVPRDPRRLTTAPRGQWGRPATWPRSRPGPGLSLGPGTPAPRAQAARGWPLPTPFRPSGPASRPPAAPGGMRRLTTAPRGQWGRPATWPCSGPGPRPPAPGPRPPAPGPRPPAPGPRPPAPGPRPGRPFPIAAHPQTARFAPWRSGPVLSGGSQRPLVVAVRSHEGAVAEGSAEKWTTRAGDSGSTPGVPAERVQTGRVRPVRLRRGVSFSPVLLRVRAVRITRKEAEALWRGPTRLPRLRS